MNIDISCFVLFIIFVFPENMFISSFIQFVRRFFPEHLMMYDKNSWLN